MPLVNCNKWNFQFESLFKFLSVGYTVAEVPITFYERANGKSKFSAAESLGFIKSFVFFWVLRVGVVTLLVCRLCVG